MEKLYNLIMEDAKSISNLQEQLQNKVDLANEVIHAYNNVTSKLEDNKRKCDSLNESILNHSHELPDSYSEKNHSIAKNIIAEIEKYDDMIEKVNDIVLGISEECNLKTLEIKRLESQVNSLNDSNQELINAVNTINDFVDSKLFNDASNALDVLNSIIKEHNVNDEHAEYQNDSIETVNESLIDVPELIDDSLVEVKSVKEFCPFLNGQHDITDGTDDFDCPVCQYYHTCPMNNCDDDIQCSCCSYFPVCPLTNENYNPFLNGQHDTTDETDDNPDVINHFEEYEDEYDKTKKSGVSNLMSLLDPAFPAIQFNADIQNTISFIEMNKEKLPINIENFSANTKVLSDSIHSILNNDVNALDNLYSFYENLYSNTIDMMLGDGIADSERISIIQNDEFNADATSEIFKAVDDFTDDLIDDQPLCNSFEFDMSGELKVISIMDIEGSADSFMEKHKDAIKFINEHKSELSDVLYSTNFIVFADNDINDVLRNTHHKEYNEDNYYTISIPAPILDKYLELYCSVCNDSSGYQYIMGLFNSMNRFSYNIDDSAVRKYIISHILSAIPMEGMLYATNVQFDRFTIDETTSNDDIVNHMSIAVGYDKLRIINIISNELNQFESFKALSDEYVVVNEGESTTKSVKEDIAELVYQIWFNQICKLLFNNDTNKVDDSQLIPDNVQSLIIDSVPIVNLHESFKHLKPIELLLATDMIYTLELLTANDEKDNNARNFNIVHTLGNLVMRIGTESTYNITSGQRLDIDCMYKLRLATKTTEKE